MPANFANKLGYYESQPISKINDKILAAAGSVWSDWKAIDQDWFSSATALELREEAADILDEEYGSAPLFALKDPRICRLMPIWLAVLARRNIAVRPVHTHRNPQEVAASLQKRDRLHIGIGELLWLRHTLEAEIHTRELPRCFTSYDDVIGDWTKVSKEISKALGVNWANDLSEIAPEIDKFVSPDLRHFCKNSSSSPPGPGLSDWASDVLDTFERWVANKPRKQDRDRLDAIRGELNRSETAFAVILHDGMEAQRSLIETAAARKSAEEDTSKLKDAYDRLEQSFADLNADLKTEMRLSEMHRDQAGLHLESLSQQAERFLKQEEQIERYAAEKLALEHKATKLENERERLRLHSADLEAQMSKLVKDHQTQVDALKARIASMSFQFNKNIDLKVADLHAMSQKLEEFHRAAELGQRRMEVGLESQISALKGELSRLQHELTTQSDFLHGALDNARVQMENLLYEKEQLLASTSWRVTKPLRVLAAKIKPSIRR